MGFTIDKDSLAKEITIRKTEILAMPKQKMADTIKHMTPRTGIRYKEIVGQIDGDIQVGPYDKSRVDSTGMDIKGRELEVFFGNAVKNFDPNEVIQSVYGEATNKGAELTQANINRYVLAFLASKAGENFSKSIWSAVRNASGTTTADLFNGFDTITAADMLATGAGGVVPALISVANKNLIELGAAITSSNAVDTLKSIYNGAHEQLQSVPSKLFVSRAIYNAYNEDYQSSHGALPYNTQYKKTFLEGSDDLCELVPLFNKKDSPYIHLSTQKNMLVGFDLESDLEKIVVEKFAAFTLQFVMAMFFGVQFESVSPEVLMVAKLHV